MRFYEFASADDKLELWRVIEKQVLLALDQATPKRKARRSTQPAKLAARAPTKAEFQRRGAEIAAANARDEVDPNAHAAERLQQAQQFQIQQQQLARRFKQQQDLINADQA
jgi:hypothetical protein